MTRVLLLALAATGWLVAALVAWAAQQAFHAGYLEGLADCDAQEAGA